VKGADLFWWQHYLIDVAFVLIIIFATLIYILFWLSKFLLSLFRVKRKLGNRDKDERKKHE